MATTLAEIRAKLQAQENRTAGNGTGGGDNAIFAHWNINEGDTARVRFLPDSDPNNVYFWVERNIINLPFAGIKGQSDSKPVTVQVPCVEMWGDSCPILAEVRTWFKDPNLEDMGRKYWKKRSYLFQGFVRENPLADDNTPENPIRRFIMSPQIFNLIKASLMDPELEELPTDYSAGLDFQIVKTSKGGYADYTTSKWSRKESALTADEQAAIEKHGLYDLKSFLPKRPTNDELEIMKEMFEASVNGEAYDETRWGNHFRPRGYQQSANASSAESQPATTPAPAAPAQPATETQSDKPDVPWNNDDSGTAEAEAPVTTPATAGSSQRAEDILAMIRNRQK